MHAHVPVHAIDMQRRPIYNARSVAVATAKLQHIIQTIDAIDTIRHDACLSTCAIIPLPWQQHQQQTLQCQRVSVELRTLQLIQNDDNDIASLKGR